MGRENLGLEIIPDTIERARVAARFDAVVAIEVVEHSEDPASFVRSLAHFLKRDGILMLSKPNINSREFSSSSGQSLATSGGAHTVVFSKSSLGSLLSRYFPSVRIWEAEGPFKDQRLIALASKDKNSAMQQVDAFQNAGVISETSAVKFSRSYLMESLRRRPPGSQLWQSAAFRLSESFLSTQEAKRAEELSRSVVLELGKKGLSQVHLCYSFQV